MSLLIEKLYISSEDRIEFIKVLRKFYFKNMYGKYD